MEEKVNLSKTDEFEEFDKFGMRYSAK